MWEGDAGIEGGGGRKEGGQGGLSSWVSTWWGCCQEDSRDASEAPSSSQRERDLRTQRVKTCTPLVYVPACTLTHTHLSPQGDQSFPHPSRMSTVWVPMCEGRAAHPAGASRGGHLSLIRSPEIQEAPKAKFSLNSWVCKTQLELSGGYLWALFFPLTANIHTFTAEILMCLHTECCSGPSGVITSVVCAPNYPSRM